MSEFSDRSQSEDLFFSRRRFLEASTLAGLIAVPRILERQVAAAAGDPPEKSRGSAVPQHPLEPLTADEVALAVETLKQGKKLEDSFRFVSVTLDEPPKREVLEFQPGSSFSRRAFVILTETAKEVAFEAVVDLRAKDVRSWKQLPVGVQPPIMVDEFIECEAAIKKSPAFLEALKKRGVTDVDLVMVDPWSAGMYGTELPEENGKRLTRALCWVRSEQHDNGYARPLDGIVVVFDLNKMAVLRVEDYGVIPLPPESANWTQPYLAKPRQGLKPLEIVQSAGPSFNVDGNEVTWQKWKFRIGFTPREGLVLHTVSYQDEGRERPVLYRAAICEMVVPYGDPAEKHFRKNAFDIGEYGIGMMANSLSLGCDCLGTIRYFDAFLTDSRGGSIAIKNAICLHEEDVGLLWKHTDWRTNESESRRLRRLAVSFIATVGNYEYGFLWYFYQDGSIQSEVKLTGIMNTTSLSKGEAAEFGVEIAPQLNAPFHQHLFVARLNMAVDGAQNSVYEVNTVSIPRGPQNPHGNAFRAESTLLASEAKAQRNVNSSSARFWRIINSSSMNRMGRPVGYRLVPGENCPSFTQPDAAVMQRAGFMSKNLWVTPYRAEERFPAGEYPNQHPGGDGLPKWVAADRPLVQTDLVLWYVFGHNHVPRLEDWPVMPVATLGFTLKPDGFFSQNPGLDVPPTA